MHTRGRGRGRAGRGQAGRATQYFSGRGSGPISGTAGSVSQGVNTGDSSIVLKTFTNERSYAFRNPLQMRKFVMAALDHCNIYNDAAFVLQCLGSPDTAGRHRLAEICQFPHAVHAGVSKETCSFQRVVCAMLHLITLPIMVNSLLTQCYNPILATVADNLDFKAICHSAEVLASQDSIADPNYSKFHQDQDGEMWQPANWVQLLQPIVSFLSQLVQRFGCNTGEQLEEMLTSVASLQQTAEKFKQGECFPGDRSVVSGLSNLAKLLAGIQVEQDRALSKDARSKQIKLRQQVQQHGHKPFQDMQDGPGELRPDGRRHDNDYTRIADITIAPTQQEVLCCIHPYLPANRPGTVMHLEADSPEAHRDLHFRLLRHDMVAELCTSAVRFQQAGGTASLLPKGASSGQALLPGPAADTTLFVYGNVEVKNLVTAKFGPGIQFEVAFDDLPVNAGKTCTQRREYWEKSRRLQHGTLIALWWQQPGSASTADAEPSITFATITMRNQQQLAPRAAGERPQIGIRLCQGCGANNDVLLAALGGALPGRTVMLQASGSFFAYEPILRALQTRQPMPLAHHIAASKLKPDPPAAEPPGPQARRTDVGPMLRRLFDRGSGNENATALPVLQESHVAPPAYQTEEAFFCVDLSCLVDADHHSEDKSALGEIKAIDVHAGDWPSQALQQMTTLDHSQLQALKAALTRELALIQGPPGTGKTFVGTQLVKALLANTQGNAKGPAGAGPHRPQPAEQPSPRGPHIGPVLIVCFTNHALDQFLEGLLDAGLTDMVRVGGRSKNESLGQYNIHELVQGKASHAQRQLLFKCFERGDGLAARIDKLKSYLVQGELGWPTMKHHLELVAPDLHDSLVSHQTPLDDEFQEVVTGHRQFWSQWLHGNKRNQAQAKAADAAAARAEAAELSVQNSFDVLGEPSAAQNQVGAFSVTPTSAVQSQGVHQRGPLSRAPPPAPDRDLKDLLASEDAWGMTSGERQKLYRHWCEELRQGWLDELKRAMQEFERVREDQRRIHADVDLNVLRGARLVGMTTAGVASKQELVAAMCPKVVIVEEAGEVFEAHILASLAPTTEHLILIGDHEQLRPKPQLYALQTESGQGYNLDCSLFERLVKSGFPVATLQEQRRMRPSIARLIRDTIYPNLLSHKSVTNYPPVKGMVKNVCFWDHNHLEGGKDENSSKQNSTEAAMAARLALYLTQQGYKAGDITILTPYVGQLMRLRAEVRKYMRFVVSEKDAEQLDMLQGDDVTEEPAEPLSKPNTGGQMASTTAGISRVSLNDSVRVATVDNFQGEESTIIILSLVRNNKHGTIGFLKTSNRINVMLSRAKHGMYILGHADTLTASKKSAMWPRVLDMLEEDESVGQALPVVCANHPEHVANIKEVSDFDTFVRDGGCSLRCTARMPCGHTCSRLCHPDDPRHLAIQCPKPCPRMMKPCGHPCSKLCCEDCGLCIRPIPAVPLPCGHTAHDLPCHRAQEPSQSMCTQRVRIQLGHCGHEIQVSCGEAAAFKADASLCTARCGADLSCGHTCQQRCGSCLQNTIKTSSVAGQVESDTVSAVPRSSYKHLPCGQKCDRTLLCGHACGKPCHGGSTCPPCTHPCAAKCVHSRCQGRCTDMCAPCAEPCPWHCDHQGKCDLPCGAPCRRLPCNHRCTKVLSCGHRCPSLCGEPCPTKKLCIRCGHKGVTAYDAIMDENKALRSFTEAEVSEDPLIVLGCGHVLPMTSLDGHVELHKAYSIDSCGQWAQPRPLKGSGIEAVKACPMCRTPLGQVLRYGRPLSHAKVQQADMKFFLQCSGALLQADKDSKHASKVAAEWTARAGDLPGRGGAKGSHEPIMKGLFQALHLAERCEGAYQQIRGWRAPTVAVFEATRCSIQRTQEQELMANSKSCVPMASLSSLEVPRPDVTPECKAMIGCCQARTVWMSVKVGILQRLARLHTSGESSDSAAGSLQVRRLWSDATMAYEQALQHGKEALTLAAGNNATQTVLQGKIAMVRLQQQRVRDLSSIQTPAIQTLLGDAAINQETAKKQQLSLLTQAEQTCQAATAQLGSSPSSSSAPAGNSTDTKTGMLADLADLAANIPKLRKLLENQVVSPEEWQSIMKGLLTGSADLANAGYLGQGHFYRCPNGHPYVIGDCGGATQTSSCPECGAQIGGRSHTVLASNTQHDEMNRMAREFGGLRH